MNKRFEPIRLGLRVKAPGWVDRPNRLLSVSAVLWEVRSFRSAVYPNATVASRATDPPDFTALVDLYESGCWTDLYAAASLMADEGDPVAAKLALLMLRHGAPLYGVQLKAEPRRIARWATSVLQASAAAYNAPQRTPRSTSRRTASPSSITAIA